MRQQVNLLPVEVGKGRKRPFSSYMVGATLLMAGAILAGGGWLAYLNHGHAKAVAALGQTEATNRTALATLRASQTTHVASAELVANLAQREAERESLRSLRVALDTRDLGNAHGFSPLLAGLGMSKPERLWLRRIDLAAGGRILDLEGSTLDPAAIPLYVQRFADDDALAGRQVQRLEITRPESQAGHVDFSIHSERRP